MWQQSYRLEYKGDVMGCRLDEGSIPLGDTDVLNQKDAVAQACVRPADRDFRRRSCRLWSPKLG